MQIGIKKDDNGSEGSSFDNKRSIIYLSIPAFRYDGDINDADTLVKTIGSKIERDGTEVYLYYPKKNTKENNVYFMVKDLQLSVPYIQYVNKVSLEAQRAIEVISNVSLELGNKVEKLRKKIEDLKGHNNQLNSRIEKIVALNVQLIYKLKCLLFLYKSKLSSNKQAMEMVQVIRKRLASIALDMLHLSDPALNEPSDASKRIRFAVEAKKDIYTDVEGTRQGYNAELSISNLNETKHKQLDEMEEKLNTLEQTLGNIIG